MTNTPIHTRFKAVHVKPTNQSCTQRMLGLIVLCILLSAWQGFAQTARLDSLRQVLTTLREDTTRIPILLKLGDDLAEQGKFEAAGEYLQEAMSHVEKSGTKPQQGKVLNALGRAAFYQGDNQQALKYWEKGTAIALELKDEAMFNSLRMNMANAYMAMGNYPLSNHIYFEVLKWAEAHKNVRQAVNCLINIAALCGFEGRSDLARTYLNRVLNDYGNILTPFQKANVLNNLGILMERGRDLDGAMKNSQALLELSESAQLNRFVGSAYTTMGMVAQQKKERNKARMFFSKAAEIQSRDKNIRDYTVAINQLALLNIEALEANDRPYLEPLFKGQPTLALRESRVLLDSVAVFFEQQDEMEQLGQVYQSFSRLERLRGNFAGALDYYIRFKQLNDTLLNTERDKKLTEAAMQYEFDKKEAATRTEQEKSDQRQRLVRNSISAGLVFTLLFLGVVWRQRNRIGKEKARSEALLLNILPSEVAEELKATGAAEAKHFAQTTILFTDFKNFTELSERLAPAELVEELNKCFKAFDEITVKYQIEKIKTIGDAYMAAGGLPDPKLGSPADVVRAALDMQAFMVRHREEREALGKPFFEMRVGVNTGPVVAGIVGVKKFQYDIWGDTVNTAARMESSGEVGEVNISEATWAVVKDEPEFAFTHRGKIEAKGKGLVDMWFVERVA